MRNKILIILFVLAIVNSGISCSPKLITWKNTQHLTKEQLNIDTLFTTKPCYRNFVDAKFVAKKLDCQLYAVARYNEFIINVDSAYVVDVDFTFNRGKSIKQVKFYYLEREVNILVGDDLKVLVFGAFGGKNGLGIVVRGVGHLEHPDYIIMSGLWHNQHKIGTHFSYVPNDTSFCYKTTIYDSSGNIVNENIVEHCEWEQLRYKY